MAEVLTRSQQNRLKELIQKKQRVYADTQEGMALMMAEKTKEYRELKEAIGDAMEEVNQIIDTYRPKDGVTPELGVTYFTAKDQKRMMQIVFDSLLGQIPTADEIASKVHTIPGETPSDDHLLSLIKRVLPKFETKTIVKEVQTILQGEVTTPESVIEILEAKGGHLEQLREYVKTLFNNSQSFKMRGGGDTVAAGTNVTITRNNNGDKVINATGGGGSVTVTTPPQSPAVDGSVLVFTVPADTKWIVSDGTTYFDGAGYALVGTTATLVNGPTQYIRAIS